ncbi:GAF domain-containing protein [Xanthocytophaga agilis]|uniref:GAF domain-containing protein n=1 Tax=Xanthocytophaga agilis TaxID=3048010 RepID=A0AAE3RAT7_9BACT|nr:GAF domain-containing protein [Xanthocytophaga agilis]MDJ1506405.1 GAF domain-containing protein [Xanthocytophaga agilis]
MASLLTRIIDAGSQYDMPEYLRNRVRPTNIICLLVIFALSIPFSGISLIYFPMMAIFPSGAAVVCILVIVSNYYGGIYYSRVVLPVLLLVLSSLYNAYFCDSIADSISSVYLVELSFTLIPFVIFDFKERGFLIFCTLFSFFIIVVFPAAWDKFDMGYDGTVLREGPLAVLTTLLATVFQLGCISGLAVINRNSEEKSNQLITVMNQKNEEVEKSRKDLEVNLVQLEKARQEENHRQWASEGIAQLSTLLRSNSDDTELFDRIIATLVKYLQANQGGLYIVEKEERTHDIVIRLAACYAYNRKKHIHQTFQAGQGLIGQTYLEGEYIYLTDIPENYLTITSGLGDSSPRALLIVPLKVNESTEAILELASFKKFEKHEIEFIVKLGESIASFIQSNRISQRTKQLLEDSQFQAEALRAQEEEMRQNMEELASTQEEMNRQQMSYLQEIERLSTLYATAQEEIHTKNKEVEELQKALHTNTIR